MLTDRGWAALGAALAMVVLWVALGEPELLGVGSLLLVGAALASILVRRFRPEARLARGLIPTVVYEGDNATVTVTIVNEGRRSVWNAGVADEVADLGTARFSAHRLRPGKTFAATYQILCRPRGVYTVGPALLTTTDPLRLAQATSALEGHDRLVVYPAVEELSGFPVVGGRDPTVHPTRPEFRNLEGEDFFTLREYQTGDDLRRVHWPTSAKRDELMIRQLETPWESRGLIILDPRATSYGQRAEFETAVRGAASVLHHLHSFGFEAGLWTGGRPVSGHDHQAYDRGMEALAGAEPLRNVDLRLGASRLHQTGRGGALVLVTGRPDRDLFEVHRLLSSDYAKTVLMSVGGPEDALEEFRRTGAISLAVVAEGSWRLAWIEAVTGGTWATASAG